MRADWNLCVAGWRRSGNFSKFGASRGDLLGHALPAPAELQSVPALVPRKRVSTNRARRCYAVCPANVANLRGNRREPGVWGLFFHQTRLLSRYRYLINDKPPQPIALSNVEQHSWLGYYLALSPNAGEQGDWEILGPGGKLAQQPVELRLSRFVADGMHEDVV